MRLLIAMAALLIVCGRAAGDFTADVAALAGAADRSAGSAGAAATASAIAARLAKLGGGASVFHQQFLLPVPTVESCAATAVVDGKPDGPAIALSPLLPSGLQIAAIADEPFGVVNLGDATAADWRRVAVAGRIVTLNVGAPATAWRTAASLGAKAIVFLGDAGAPPANTAFLERDTDVPVSIPRFYCDDAEAVAGLRSGRITAMRIMLRARWEERRMENILCLIPGRQNGPGPGANPRWSDSLIVLQCRYDGASQVLTRAPGAIEAANAAGMLALAERIAAAPQHATVLLAFTEGDEWNLRGTRALLDLLGRGPSAGRQTSLLLDRLARAQAAVDNATAMNATLSQVADAASGGAAWPVIGAAASDALSDQLLRDSSRLEDRLEAARLAHGPVSEELEAARGEMMMTSAALSGRLAIGAAERKVLAATAAEIQPVFVEDLRRLAARRDALHDWPDMRAAIGPRPVYFFFSLDLTNGAGGTGAGEVGFFARSQYAPQLDTTGPLAAFAQALRRYAVQAPAFAVRSLENRYTLETFFPTPRAFSSDAALADGIPGGALATLTDPAPMLDTPGDTRERIDAASMERQLAGVAAMLVGTPGQPGAIADPYFYARTDLPLYAADQEIDVYERTAAESLPRLKAAGAVVAMECRRNGAPLGPALAGTRRLDVQITTADGSVTLPQALRIPGTRDVLQAFTFNDGQAPTRSLLINDTAGLAGDFYPDAGHPLRTMLFDCRRLDVYDTFDPRGLDLLTSLEVLDARRLDAANLSHVVIDGGNAASGRGVSGGMAAVFFPPELRWSLLGNRGIGANRFVVTNADAEHPGGTGFATTDLAEIGPLSWRNAQDLFALDAQRKAALEKFGISNEVVRELHAAAQEQLDAAQKAKAAGDTPRFLAASDAVWSLEQQVYETLIATSDGIIHGVIFLLLGIIPFSYFLERLLVGATNVYRQIAWFGGIFALMTAALWFHPAFRISSAPIMIILAFFILILSCTVVYILWGKFDEELQRLRSSGDEGGAGGGGHITSLQRGAVLGAAVRLGLSNMRRRGMRTALTLITLVLLTFTLLCFTSVREAVRVSPVAVAFSHPVPPAGILIRQRNWRTLPEQALDLAAGLGTVSRAATQPAADVPLAGRWWLASPRAEQLWSLPIRNAVTGQVAYTSALLGLDRTEAAFQAAAIDAVLPGLTTAPDDACWLPEEVATTAGVRSGDRVFLCGHALTVAGTFTDDSFARLRELTDDPMTPLDAGAASGQANRSETNENSPVEARGRFMAPTTIAVVRAGLARELGARLTSIMVRPADSGAAVEAAAEALARRVDATVYASDGTVVRSINATAGARPEDFSTVAVPMAIAAVIVLNTMLGAVAERTREIHVYTSVGLAPSHVGMLFLAEAAALGTLGVVIGYIGGQGLATVLSGTHWLPGVDLNYSSMSAIVTMGAVLALVMVSSLWPARAASRVAAPSLARAWRLPPAVGDVLDVELPFTVNETAARGVLAFVAEFLAAAGQTGSAKFTADSLRPFTAVDPFGPETAPTRGLTARIWLAPYDLGIIQSLRLTIHPTQQANVFEVRARLTREAGNPATWQRLNRPFLKEIRKQFLLWRALPAASVQRYVEASQAFFSAAT